MNKYNLNNEASINLKNNYFKFWLYEKIWISHSKLRNLASNFVKNVYKFSIRELYVSFHVLKFEELQILVSGGHLEWIHFKRNVIENDDGSITEFGKVFELLCCKSLTIALPDEHHGVSKNTTNKIIQILSSDQIPAEQKITLGCLPQDFDFLTFSQFLKANMFGRQHCFDLTFARLISVDYKNQLQQFIDEIIQIRGIYAHTIPLISFDGENLIAYQKLCKMRYEKVEGILRKPKI